MEASSLASLASFRAFLAFQAWACSVLVVAVLEQVRLGQAVLELAELEPAEQELVMLVLR